MLTDALIERYLLEQIEIAQEFPVKATEALVKAVEVCYHRGRMVFAMGNGGGANTAEHFASDLKMHPYVSEDKREAGELPRMQVHCLNESNGIMTRIANDIGYKETFTEQLKNYPLTSNDLLIAFSGSGNSPNIISAFEYVKKFSVKTALVGGRDGGKAKGLVDICVLIPGTSKFPGQTGANDNCFHIEDFQGSIAHMITGILKERLNG